MIFLKVYKNKAALVVFSLTIGLFFSCSPSRKVVENSESSTWKQLPNTTPNQTATFPEIKRENSFYAVSEMELNQSNREFRGVWIATVANIDWPNSGMDTWEKQKTDFIALLDYYHQLNFNAVIVQVRAAGDAFYTSRFAPWSRYLTGQEGIRPKTSEDPLSWMILQAHKRGLEFHAWFNPFRATFDLNTAKLSPQHDYFTHPEWMVQYGPKFYYNPGIPEVRTHMVNIIEEVVQNYDVDAVHFDDYFYPYKLDKQVFKDSQAFSRYGNGKNIEDWRRENVNLLVQAVHQKIKSTKPWVQFGISPFGVWRNNDRDPNGSNTRGGVSNYDDLYADPITWMKSKWIDYLIPQLYWSMDYKLASYRELVGWWSKNSHNTKIYVGNGPYKIRDNADLAWNDPKEMSKQVALAKTTIGIDGNAYFSARSLYTKNTDVAKIIKDEHYKSKVLSPSFQNLGMDNSARPIQAELISNSNGLHLFLPNSIDPIYRYAVVYSGDNPDDIASKKDHVSMQKVFLEDRNKNGFPIASSFSGSRYLAISFIDRYGRETSAKIFEIKSK
ncbi:family 10 glycosylhydrolase [Belliella sp. DSM 107340]|uniref:Family 10 glycosylhydrolase n=1 Tax=Belliella calami TaxID=2923436 RepID=A0ABS9UJB9_9BACT|nr:family 10 glycosylhydrolase [Belliella calami]MCH7396672.1 family 10 glycosylhydrolase [Belliella calami]